MKKHSGRLGKTSERHNKTSERIVKTAADMFAKHGYENVSLRDIADAAGTSIGNLTYYFPQKCALIASLRAEHLEELSKSMRYEGDAMLNFIHFLRQLKKSHDDLVLYFKNLVSLCRDSEPFADNVASFRASIHKFARISFEKMVDAGWMRNDITADRYDTLAHILVLIGAFWVQNTNMTTLSKKRPKITAQKVILDLLYPYFTPEGIEHYRSVSAEVNEDGVGGDLDT